MRSHVSIALTAIVCSSVSAFLGAHLALTWQAPARSQAGPASSDAEDRWETKSLGFNRLSAQGDEPSSVTAPERLPLAIQATALQAPAEAPTDPLRALVQAEMPDATSDELDVWTEQLQELDTETAREILRLRRSLGRP